MSSAITPVAFEQLSPTPLTNGYREKSLSTAQETFLALQKLVSEQVDLPAEVSAYPDPILVKLAEKARVNPHDLLHLIYMTLLDEKGERSPFKLEDRAFFKHSVAASKTARCCLRIGLWVTSILTAIPLVGALDVVANWAQENPRNSYALTQGTNANSVFLNLTNFFATGICPDRSASSNIEINPLLERSIQHYKNLAVALVTLRSKEPELAELIASSLNVQQRLENAIPRYFSPEVSVIIEEVVERHCQDLREAQTYVLSGRVSFTTPTFVRNLHRMHQLEEGLRLMEEGHSSVISSTGSAKDK